MALLREDEEMAAFFRNADYVGPLIPREGLWGGHTEVFCDSYTVDSIREIMEYIDVSVSSSSSPYIYLSLRLRVSLYPTINSGFFFVVHT